MKKTILVIDDNKVHLGAAVQQLGDAYELTTCGNYESAVRLTVGGRRDENLRAKLKAQHELAGMSAQEADWVPDEESVLPYWDIVLCDLMMPFNQRDKGMDFVGQEMAVGWSLALQAVQGGAKYVCVATTLDHHHHPASAMLDYTNGRVFNIDGASVLFTNFVRIIEVVGSERTCKRCSGTGHSDDDSFGYRCMHCEGDGIAKGKDWQHILNTLLAT